MQKLLIICDNLQPCLSDPDRSGAGNAKVIDNSHPKLRPHLLLIITIGK